MTDRCLSQLASEFPRVPKVQIEARLKIWRRSLAGEMTSPALIDEVATRQIRLALR